MSITWKIFAKEVLEARRDRSLLVHLVLVPVFMYPLLGFGAWQVFQIIQGASEGREEIAWVDPSLPAALRDSLQLDESLRLIDAPPVLLEALAYEDAQTIREYRSELDSLSLDALVLYEPSARGERLRIAYDSSREGSDATESTLEDAAEVYLESRRLAEAEGLGLSDKDLRPLSYEVENTSSSSQVARYVLSIMLPLLLVLMLPQGAYYTALDTVVGERERGTLETLLSSPATRQQILVGKFLFVTLSSLLTFSLNLLSLALFLGFALQLMGLEASLSFSLNPADLVVVMLSALLVAAFLAAAMMVLAVPCKNYREGQSALMPLFLVSSLSGLVVATQGDSFPTWLALIPVVNVAALVRETLRGELDWNMVVLTLSSLALLTSASLMIAARVGRREDILFDANLSLRRLLRREERSSA